MKERPILFSAPMVRALLDGTKTQTRRVVKPQPRHLLIRSSNDGEWYDADCVSPGTLVKCPYGAPGDRLWVRETFGMWPGSLDEERQTLYRATVPEAPGGWPSRRGPIADFVRWRPSIHMPRRFSRLTLEIVSVRVERVQEISEADALAEGVPLCDYSFGRAYGGDLTGDGITRVPMDSARSAFLCLWDSINAARGFSWASNPWCWCIAFKRVEQPAAPRTVPATVLPATA